MHPDEDLASAGHRIRDLAALKDLTGGTVPLIPDCFHPRRPLIAYLIILSRHLLSAEPSTPVAKCSRKSCLVMMRYAAQVRLRNAVFHWARVAVLNDPKCRRFMALRARGHSYDRALWGGVTGRLGSAASCCSGRCCSTPAMTSGTRRSPEPSPSVTRLDGLRPTKNSEHVVEHGSLISGRKSHQIGTSGYPAFRRPSIRATLDRFALVEDDRVESGAIRNASDT